MRGPSAVWGFADDYGELVVVSARVCVCSGGGGAAAAGLEGATACVRSGRGNEDAGNRLAWAGVVLPHVRVLVRHTYTLAYLFRTLGPPCSLHGPRPAGAVRSHRGCGAPQGKPGDSTLPLPASLWGQQHRCLSLYPTPPHPRLTHPRPLSRTLSSPPRETHPTHPHGPPSPHCPTQP